MTNGSATRSWRGDRFSVTFPSMREENKRGKDPSKFTWREILTFIGSAGYVASPIDLLSESVLGPLGLGDDVVAIIIAGVTLYKAVQRFRAQRPAAGAAGPGSAGSTTSYGTPPDDGRTVPPAPDTAPGAAGQAGSAAPGRKPGR